MLQNEGANLVAAAGLVLDKNDSGQLVKAIAILQRQQTNTAFTTTGVAPNFVLTPSLPVTAYAANQRFRVNFNVAGSGANAINVSALGNKLLKQYDGTGAKVAAVIAANQLADIEYDGVDFVILDPLPVTAPSIQGAFKNLQVSSTGLSANVSVTVDEIVVESAANVYQKLRNVALSIAGTAVGANGLDAGALTINTWYSVWVIGNSAITAGLLSLSGLAPALPAGYTHKARVGWIRTDGTASKFPLSFKQFGRRIQYVAVAGSNVSALPVMASGAAGNVASPAYAAVGVSSFIPPTAVSINGNIGTASLALFAANGNAGVAGGANPPILTLATPASSYQTVEFDVLLESTNIYWANNGTAHLACIGWGDNL